MSQPSSFADPASNPYAGAGDFSRTANTVLTANTSQYQAQMGQAAQSTNAVAGAVAGLSGKVDGLFKMGGRTLKIVSAADVATLTGAAASAAALQKQMSPLAATAAVNNSSFNAFGKAVDNAFSNFPVHRGDVVALVNELANLSVKQRDIGQLTNTMIKFGEATGESIPDLTQNLMQLSRQMDQLDPSKISQYANATVTLSKSAGTSATGILAFSQAIAPLARQAGLSESAVLGVSTAFSKAGADGYVASTAFNSILSDITNLTRTGSPQLAKYSSFVGMTVDQFKRMPAAKQITDIFNTVAKGGPQALNFVNELGLGTRALSAFQAVAQTGGIGQYINLAQSSSTNTRNLDRGAAAARNNLSDALSEMHNQFTRLASTLGGPLLGPLTLIVHLFTDLMKGATSLAHALSPLLQIVMAVAGPLVGLAGMILPHAGLVGGIAAARMLVNSGPRLAFGAGRQVGTSMAGGMTQQAAEAAFVASGGVLPPDKFRTQAGYRMGLWSAGSSVPFFGRATPPEQAGRPMPGPGRPMPGPGRPMPGPGTAGAAESEAAAAERAATQSVSRLRTATAYVTQGIASVPVFFQNSQVRALRDASLPPYERSAYGPSVSVSDRFAAWRASTQALAAERGVGGILASGAGTVGRSTLGLAGQTIASGAGMLGMGAMAGGRAALSGLGGFLMSPMGLILGASLALPLLSKINRTPSVNYDVSDSFNGITKYDQLLNQSSTNLADFSSSVQGATNKLNSLPSTAGKSLADVAKVTGVDISAAAGGYKLTQPALGNLTKGAAGAGAAVAYLQTLGVQHGGMDAKTLQAVKEDLIHVYGPNTAQSILNSYLRTNPASTTQQIDYSALGKSASRFYTAGGMDQFKSILGQGMGGLASQAALSNTAAGNRAELGGIVALMSGALGNRGYTTEGSSASAPAFKMAATFLQQQFGGSQAQWIEALGLRSPGQSLQSSLVSSILTTSQGRQFISSAGLSPESSTASILAALTGAQFPAASQNTNNQQLRGAGPLGSFVAGNALIQSAMGGQSGDPRTQQRAMETLAAQALKTSGNFTAANEALLKLSDTMGGADTVSGQLIASAAQWARTLQGFQTPYESRVGQLQTAAQTYQASQAAANAPGASAATIAQAQQDRAAYEAQKQSYDQYLISVQQTAIQFQTNMERSEQDYQTEVYRSQRNFQIQMTQSEQDYYRQRSRTIQDFNIQMARQAQSAAESIYDPFSRVQAQSVVNGGMLLGNLTDENQRIQQQYAQLGQLRQAGLSQAAIDTLQLSNPNNAQQVNSIATSILNDPGMIQAINKAIATRQAATTQLTQSNYNEDFRNTVADFERGLTRTAQDYQTAHDRAVQAQQISLSDMSDDYNKMVTRAGEDLTQQMTELYGSFATQYTRTLRDINNDIGKYAPALSKTLTSELVKAESAINGVTTPDTLATISGGGDLSSNIYQGGTSANAAEHDAGSEQSPSAAQAYAQSQLSRYGWNAGQMTDLLSLWNKESGWRWNATNPTSGAYGIPQSLPASKMSSAGGDWRTNADTQINWGLSYIKGRYGSPSGAWAHEVQYNWYGSGGTFDRPTVIGVGEKGPEQVLPLDAKGVNYMANFYEAVSRSIVSQLQVGGRGIPGKGMGGDNYSYHQDYSTNFTGPITVKADDPKQLERQLAARKRYQNLAHPGTHRST